MSLVANIRASFQEKQENDTRIYISDMYGGNGGKFKDLTNKNANGEYVAVNTIQAWGKHVVDFIAVTFVDGTVKTAGPGRPYRNINVVNLLKDRVRSFTVQCTTMNNNIVVEKVGIETQTQGNSLKAGGSSGKDVEVFLLQGYEFAGFHLYESSEAIDAIAAVMIQNSKEYKDFKEFKEYREWKEYKPPVSTDINKKKEITTETTIYTTPIKRDYERTVTSTTTISPVKREVKETKDYQEIRETRTIQKEVTIKETSPQVTPVTERRKVTFSPREELDPPMTPPTPVKTPEQQNTTPSKTGVMFEIFSSPSSVATVNTLSKFPVGKFLIINKQTELIVDVSGAQTSQGAKVILWKKKAKEKRSNQEWIFEEGGTIKCGHADLVLMAQVTPKSTKVTTGKPSGALAQKWEWDGSKLTNRLTNTVLSTKNRKVKGKKLTLEPASSDPAQIWDLAATVATNS